jgi:hypothetical protein
MHTLKGCTVEMVSSHVARPLILQYEWLGDMGRATMFVGLKERGGELIGVACFGHGPAGAIRAKIGKPAWCLERGACVHWAPPNAASFLIARACKLICQTTKVERFFAYCDPMAGEYGAVYQAANWVYLGQGLQGWRPHRIARDFCLPPGADPDNPANWKTTRVLRRTGGLRTYAAARRAGWRIEPREGKHVYAVHVGREAKGWKAELGKLPPYPKPRPMLKCRGRDRGRTTVGGSESSDMAKNLDPTQGASNGV